MNWDRPEERAELIERVGPAEYNRLHAEHLAATVIKTVNGYPLRYTHSRFGRLIMVGGANVAFTTLEAAELHASGLPERVPVADEVA